MATMYTAVMLLATLILPASYASAALAPLPAPTAPTTSPSGLCEWMGEMQSKSEYSYTYNDASTEDSIANVSYEMNVSTAQVPGKTCGMLWAGEFHSVLTQTSTAACIANWTMTDDMTGNGVGNIDSFLVNQNNASPKWLNVNANGEGGTAHNAFVYDNAANTPCRDLPNRESTVAWTPGSSASNCQFDTYTREGFFINANSQSTVGTCTHDLTNQSSGSLTYAAGSYEQVTWRFKKINCDNTINSDGGSKSDCQEYDAHTNPMNAADDPALPADSTKPTITLNAPLNGGIVLLGSSASASFTCQDETGGSGIASCSSSVANGSALNTATVGTKTFVVTATDNAGNTRTATATYTVQFKNSGFLGPIDSTMINKAKAGQTVPVQFRLLDGSGNPISDPASFVSLTSSGAACNASAPADEIEQYSGGSGLQYQGNGYWQFNWKTPKTYAGQCRIIYLTLSDGSQASAKFQF